MKTINLKFSASSAATTPAQPDAQPGISGNVFIYRVANVPDSATLAQVITLFNQTVIPFPDKLPVPWTVLYSQLGNGNMIYKRVLVRADQLPAGATFRVPAYPGVGIRTCCASHLRKIGGDTSVVINCGVGVSIVELSPSDELEVIQGGEA
ncbi:hypothetical protein [Thiothrix subterranea]|uniref:Uncharacterized protein n=1 Tax=Thiothrix subterranea TaxID=2735563 RepID=A0AA51MQY0_9GAMM|nr:hypothetical protein [Thiothrix subterranea]MDQ5770485.1 hypothetical protein [Thiothrix subterranea]WML86837.1 hypothetical protein RCG00_21465 [Thiothrix subterranea]